VPLEKDKGEPGLLHMLKMSLRRLLFICLAVAIMSVMPLSAHNVNAILPPNMQERLQRGEVVVGLRDDGGTKFVTGSVLIDQPPDKVWPIMTNPFEFRRGISPRMREVEVIRDMANMSILKVTLDVVLIPHFTYTVESTYENNERVDFKRIGGVLKDFRGSWQMSPQHNGSQTELTYSMYVDPGFPVPQWIIREGVKTELPRTLTALRKRVDAVCTRSETMEPHTIMAAAVTHLAPHQVFSAAVGRGATE
jgi:carbon monoxide dehydrogenase subunit G